jgi:hypothetical protein
MPYQAPPTQAPPSQPAPTQPAQYQPAQYQPAQYQPAPYQAAPQYQPSSYPGAPEAYAAGAAPWSSGQAPTRRGIGVGALIVWLAVTAVVCAGAGFFVGHASRKTTTSSSPGRATTTPTTAVKSTIAAIPPGNGAVLRAHLIPMPAGAKALTTSGATDDVMTLDQFLKKFFDTDPLERGRLTARSFEIAVQGEWVTKADVEVHDQIVQFGNDDGAKSYVLGQHSAYEDDPEWPDNFTIPGVTLGYGFENPELDKAGNRRAVLLCQDGPFTVIVFFFTPAAFDRTSEIAVLKSQVAALSH